MRGIPKQMGRIHAEEGSAWRDALLEEYLRSQVCQPRAEEHLKKEEEE